MAGGRLFLSIQVYNDCHGPQNGQPVHMYMLKPLLMVKNMCSWCSSSCCRQYDSRRLDSRAPWEHKNPIHRHDFRFQ